LLAAERRRYEKLLAATVPGPGGLDRLERALGEIERAR